MNTPFESWKSWLLGLSPIPRSIDKLYRKSIESALEFWGMYQQKPAWYFNKKTQEFIENKDSENRENLPKDYYSDVGVLLIVLDCKILLLCKLLLKSFV
jgi:predicted phosphoadenosine phosphosulfate sulfurtransferase